MHHASGYIVYAMKGCFLLQRNFARTGNVLAKLLMEKYGLTAACAYVYTRPSYEFLKQQTEVPYSNLLLDEDIHAQFRKEKIDYAFLEQFEKEYGIPNLWPYLSVDRIIMFNNIVREYPYNTPQFSHDDMLRILQVTAKAIIKFLDEEKPDFVFFSAIGGVGSLLLYEIAKKKGIKTLVVVFPIVENTISLHTTADFEGWIEEDFTHYLAHPTEKDEWTARAETFITAFRNTPKLYSKVHLESGRRTQRKQHLDFLLPSHLYQSTKWFLHLTREHITSPSRRDYSYIPPHLYLLDRIKRKTRNLIGAERYYDTFNPEVPYCFFPLHLEPEISLLLLARFCTDQIEVIRQIALSLPVGHILYTKEHPHMVPYRPHWYYRELKKIPNVRLLPPNLSSFEIIKKARLITTITGSVGWEAILLQKPVITLGTIFYNRLSFVKHSREPEKLPTLVQEALATPPGEGEDRELHAYIAALLKNSAQSDFLQVWEHEHDPSKKAQMLLPFATLIAQKAGLQQSRN